MCVCVHQAKTPKKEKSPPLPILCCQVRSAIWSRPPGGQRLDRKNNWIFITIRYLDNMASFASIGNPSHWEEPSA